MISFVKTKTNSGMFIYDNKNRSSGSAVFALAEKTA